jgi:hypothetical protein
MTMEGTLVMGSYRLALEFLILLTFTLFNSDEEWN